MAETFFRLTLLGGNESSLSQDARLNYGSMILASRTTPHAERCESALPVPRATMAETHSIRPARTPNEKKLLAIWKELSGSSQVRIDDNFFDIGDDSISSMQVAILAEKVGFNLSVGNLFAHSDVCSLAAQLTARRHARVGISAPLMDMHYEDPAGGSSDWLGNLKSRGDIKSGDPTLLALRSGSSPALFLVHPAGGSAMCYRTLAHTIDTHRAIWGIEAPDRLEFAGSTLSDLAESYIYKIREKQSEGPYWLGGWSLGGIIAFEICRLLEDRGEDVAIVFVIDGQLPTSRLIETTLCPMAADTRGLISNAVKDLSVLSNPDTEINITTFFENTSDDSTSAVLQHLKTSRIFNTTLAHRFAEKILTSYLWAPELMLNYRWYSVNAPIMLLLAQDTENALEGGITNDSDAQIVQDEWHKERAGYTNCSRHPRILDKPTICPGCRRPNKHRSAPRCRQGWIPLQNCRI